MRRIVVVLAVAATMAAILAVMAAPAFAAKPAPTKEECVGTRVAVRQGQELTGQQKQLVKQFAGFTDCIQASSG